VRSYIVSSDTIKSNDTSQNKKIVTLGHPLISVQNDTICRGGVGMLMAQGNSINDVTVISKGLYLVSFYQKKSSITKKLIVE
jgi:hypothetical protein